MAAGVAVDLLRGGVSQEMRQVGADDDQGFRAAPQAFEHFGDSFRRGVADGQRQQREIGERALQEGQVDFQRMLLRVCRRADADLRQLRDQCACRCIQAYLAEWCGECFAIGQGQTAEGNPMRRAEQDHAADCRPPRRQRGVGVGCGRAGIDITGMRRDQRLGLLHAGYRCRGQQLIDRCLQLAGVGRVEHAGDGGGTDRHHVRLKPAIVRRPCRRRWPAGRVGRGGRGSCHRC